MSLARLLPPMHRYVQLSAPGALDLAVNGGTEGISELGTTNLQPGTGSGACEAAEGIDTWVHCTRTKAAPWEA